ncbi:unnamed protein product [Cladocopium goreaui]|uniref:Uncharacterized protein n=1 Tax=Cladocopium goreaui TaxID=2562237 RepID=A0A9P1DV20_9DINO|nr:unnamed protein product [Cladocopium goreaui]
MKPSLIRTTLITESLTPCLFEWLKSLLINNKLSVLKTVVQTAFLLLMSQWSVLTRMAWAHLTDIIWPDLKPAPCVLNLLKKQKGETDQETDTNPEVPEVFSKPKRFYAVGIRSFLAILVWDVIQQVPRVALRCPNIYEAFANRKVHNIDPRGLHFLQKYLNKVGASFPDLRLQLPAPLRA